MVTCRAALQEVVWGVEVPDHTSWPWQVLENQPENRIKDLRVMLLELSQHTQKHRILNETIGKNRAWILLLCYLAVV